MNHNDQSQSFSSVNTDPGPILGIESQDSTRLTGSPVLGLTDSNITIAPAQLNDGKLHALDIVGENYEIISLIGVGGMGYVYRVRHRILQKQYAMKTLSSQHVSEIAWRRLQVEAQAIARMNHPNIVGIHNLGLHEDRLPYYVMDLLDGESLADRLKRGTLTLAQALPIFIEVCKGLGYAHKKGIIHRDIKPGNIILLKTPDSSGATVKIVDFGIAKLSGASDPSNQNLTCIGEVFGSPYYMSPEQCEGKRIDARSDIYSVGCTIFEALVGHPPFRGNNPVQTMVMHQSHEPPSMSEASGKNFPDEIEELVATLLAKAPMDRYQTLDKVAEDLQAIASGREVQTKALFDTHTFFAAKEEDDDEQAPRKNLALPITVAIIAIAAVLVSASILFFQSKQNEHLPSAAEKAPEKAQVAKKTDTASSIATSSKTSAKISGTQKQPFSHMAIGKNGKAVKQFDFPDDIYLGRIIVGEGSEYWEAKGKQFPALAKLELVASPQLMAQLDYFDRFRADDLYGVRLFQQAMPQQKQASGNNSENSKSTEFLLPENYESDITEAIKHLQHMTSLKKLDLLDAPNANDSCIVEMNKLANLTELRASKTGISGLGLSQLTRLKQLNSLTYSEGTQISTLLKALAGSKKLTSLGLDRPVDRSLTLSDLRLIASCKNLTRLDLDDCKIDRSGLAILSTLPHLKMLYASDNKIDQECFSEIKAMSNLESIDFDSRSWTPYCQLTFNRLFPKIKHVKFEKDSKVI
ncbi:protein kinase [bacterium]|nr:protein kinase [bacterium]MBP9809353.1 protein kinase [bacterium]